MCYKLAGSIRGEFRQGSVQATIIFAVDGTPRVRRRRHPLFVTRVLSDSTFPLGRSGRVNVSEVDGGFLRVSLGRIIN